MPATTVCTCTVVISQLVHVDDWCCAHEVLLNTSTEVQKAQEGHMCMYANPTKAPCMIYRTPPHRGPSVTLTSLP